MGAVATLTVAAFIAAVYALMGWMARAMGLDHRIERVHDVALLLSAALGGALLAGVFITLLLSSIGFLPTGQDARVTMPLLVGDVIGVAVITPLVLRATRRRVRRRCCRPRSSPALRRLRFFRPASSG